MENNNPVTLTSRTGNWVLNFLDKASVAKSDDSPNGTSNSSAPRISRHPKFFFDNVLIAIQVRVWRPCYLYPIDVPAVTKIEDTLFNVHKYQLTKLEVFSDMFKMPGPEGDGHEKGSSPEYPIIINGVAASDFVAPLTVLYAGQFSSNQLTPDAPLIVPAFRLANMFNFPELQKYLLLYHLQRKT